MPGNCSEMQVLRPDPSPTESETLGWRPSFQWFKTPSRWLLTYTQVGEPAVLVSAPALNQSLELNFSGFTVLTNCMQNLIHVAGLWTILWAPRLYAILHFYVLSEQGYWLDAVLVPLKFPISESWEAMQILSCPESAYLFKCLPEHNGDEEKNQESDSIPSSWVPFQKCWVLTDLTWSSLSWGKESQGTVSRYSLPEWDVLNDQGEQQHMITLNIWKQLLKYWRRLPLSEWFLPGWSYY